MEAKKGNIGFKENDKTTEENDIIPGIDKQAVKTLNQLTIKLGNELETID